MECFFSCKRHSNNLPDYVLRIFGEDESDIQDSHPSQASAPPLAPNCADVILNWYYVNIKYPIKICKTNISWFHITKTDDFKTVLLVNIFSSTGNNEAYYRNRVKLIILLSTNNPRQIEMANSFRVEFSAVICTHGCSLNVTYWLPGSWIFWVI